MPRILLGMYDPFKMSADEIAEDMEKKKNSLGYYTAESVTIGHPDRMCDQFSDAILDAYVSKDPGARVAIECMGGHGKIWVCGEVTSSANVDIPAVIHKTYRDIGYEDALDVEVHVAKQSPDIARGVDTGGAGDQGIVVGYACRETPEYLPLETALARRLTEALTFARRSGRLPYLRPDGKSQVTVNPETGHIKAVVLSSQHDGAVPIEQVRKDLRTLAIEVLCSVPLSKGDRPGSDRPRGFCSVEDASLYINPAGPFVQGGFSADTGLTGRKLVVDFYGPRVPVGGGATHGKDLTKTDRSGAIEARNKAIEILNATPAANQVTIEYAYAIGIPGPICERVVVEE